MKVLILYYSMTGNVYRMAKLVAEGVKEGGAEPVIKTVPELLPASVIESDELISEAKKEQETVPIAEPEELPEYDAIIVGTPTRFGNMCAQMRNFWDRTGPLWAAGSLVDMPVGSFCSTMSMHGGQEATSIANMFNFIHHGMIIVGVPYTLPELNTTDAGGTPYGPSHTAWNPPKTPITEAEAVICRAFGKRIAKIAAKLSAK